MLSLIVMENVTYVSDIMYFHIMHKIFGCTEWFGQVPLACSSVLLYIGANIIYI